MLSFIKNLSKYHNLVSFGVVAFVMLSIISLTLVLVRTNQDNRSRAASGICTVDEPLVLDSSEQEFLSILNAHRLSINKGELRASQILTKAAQWQAEDMIANNYRSHTDSTGRVAQQRLIQCGITGTAGENIVWGTVSAQDAFNKWMNSPGHKANMESGSYSQIGISRKSEGSTWVWVNTFSTGNDGTEPDLENPDNPTPTNTPTPTTGTGLCTGGSNSISGVAYVDKNSNANFDQGVDLTVAGRTILLKDPNNNLLDTALSGTHGLYCFSNLSDGTYNVTYHSESGKTIVEPPSGTYSGLQVINGHGLAYVDFGDVDSVSPTISPQPTDRPLPTPTLSITPNPSPPVNPKTVKFSFKIPGIGGNTSLGENPYPYKGFDAIIGIVDSNEKELLDIKLSPVGFESNNYTFTSEASFEESILLPDNFIWITIPKATTHQIIIKSLPQGETINIPTLLLRTGDFNFDDNFDLNDYIDLVSCIKGVKCFYGFEFYDINLDRNVDALDLNILYRAIIDFN